MQINFFSLNLQKKFLFDDVYLTENQINDVLTMLSMAECQTEGGKYILLLDGFNEICSVYQTTIIHQLNELAGYQNMIIILTSRFRLRPQHLAKEMERNGAKVDFFRVVPGKFVDYVSLPKQNGYRALHATIMPDSDMSVLVIIRQTRKLRKKI